MEIRKLFRAGNSLVLAIPTTIASFLGWRLGDNIEICLEPGKKLQLCKVERQAYQEKKEKGGADGTTQNN